ncbi:hypothetical protein [Vibrio metschnikovii]|uniref:Uncharacterized protein n=1 Tax=Vibrio metschnikovii TaxID=28172 RepID=A0A9X0UPI3_VIBME|nr:hypothetical protein [Vibrio metschnikovii]MBC5853038.1 hypothetical protein [Vibrio metschnikovii]
MRKIRRIKDVAIVNSATALSNLGDLVDYLPMKNVSETGCYRTVKSARDKLPTGLNNFTEGDFLLAKISPCFENGKSALIESLETGYGMGSSELIPIKPVLINPKFLSYLLSSPDFINAGVNEYKGATGHQRISPRFVAEYTFNSEVNQADVVKLLDEKTEAIDKGIKILTQKLHHLEEYKTALIHNAVTKGLDANGKRFHQIDESGVSLVSGMPYDSEGFDLEVGTPLVRIRDIGKNSCSIRYNGNIENHIFVEKGDLLIGMDGDTKVALWEGDSSVLNQRVLRARDCNAKYLYLLSVILPKLIDEVYAKEQATTVHHISLNQIKKLRVPFLLSETNCLYDQIKRKIHLIDKMKDNVSKKIDLLLEYKKSLINEAVSGQ